MAYTTIDNGSEHFNTVLWSGDGNTNRTISGVGFQPDLTWIKRRSSTYSHALLDSNRGGGKALSSDNTDAENSNNNILSSWNSDGFVIAASAVSAFSNTSGQTYVGWNWKANGGTTSSNTDGSITSTVQANTTAGFSIVTYTSNNTEGATIGHGLNSAPEIVIIKGRESADNWPVFNGTSTTNSRSLHLEENVAEIPVSSYNFWNLYWDETRPSSTVVTLGVDAKVNKSGGEGFVAYCFHSVKGYSKIGKYTGNGSTDGAFVYTGFKPQWVMIKRTDDTSSWSIRDTARSTFNVVTNRVWADLSNAESTSTTETINILSNGFKTLNNIAGINTSGGTYLYYAIAEHPFVSSKGVPVTAR